MRTSRTRRRDQRRDQHRRMVAMWGWVRVGVGVFALALPRAAASFWVGRPGRLRPVRVLGRALGARDVVLGVGTVAAARTGAPSSNWVLAGGTSDLLDAVITVKARPEIPRRRSDLVAAASAGSALVAVVLAAPPRR